MSRQCIKAAAAWAGAETVEAQQNSWRRLFNALPSLPGRVESLTLCNFAMDRTTPDLALSLSAALMDRNNIENLTLKDCCLSRVAILTLSKSLAVNTSLRSVSLLRLDSYTENEKWNAKKRYCTADSETHELVAAICAHSRITALRLPSVHIDPTWAVDVFGTILASKLVHVDLDGIGLSDAEVLRVARSNKYIGDFTRYGG